MSDGSLPGGQLPGGLLVRKDKSERQPAPSSRQRSLLGLDKLAAEKARERAAAAASEPMQAPLPMLFKRPLPPSSQGDSAEPSSSRERHYRRPREETPSHGGGVNEARSADIQQRVKDRLKSKGQVFASSSNAGGSAGTGGASDSGRRFVPPSPAPSMSGSEWEAPSPQRSSLVPDRAQFGSEPRGFLDAGTPLDTPSALSTAGLSHRPSASVPTPQPSPMHPPAARECSTGGKAGSMTPRHPGVGGGASDGGVAEEDEWDDYVLQYDPTDRPPSTTDHSPRRPPTNN